MARLPDEVIDRLKREAPIRKLLEGRGCEFQRHGHEIACCCPLPGHDDKSPSFVVNEEKNLWRCHGRCQVGGSVIDLVMRLEGSDFRAAVEWLQRWMGEVPAADGSTGQAASERPRNVEESVAAAVPSPGSPAAAPESDFLFAASAGDDRALLNAVIDFYAARLAHCPEATTYLAGRGLLDPEAIKVHRIGVSDRTLGLRLPTKGTLAGARIRASLHRMGILRESGHEAFVGQGHSKFRQLKCRVVCVPSMAARERSPTGAPALPWL